MFQKSTPLGLFTIGWGGEVSKREAEAEAWNGDWGGACIWVKGRGGGEVLFIGTVRGVGGAFSLDSQQTGVESDLGE